MTARFNGSQYLYLNKWITGEGKTYGFLLTGLPGVVTAEVQFKHGDDWFAYPDMDYTAEAGVVSEKFFAATTNIRIALSAVPDPGDPIILSFAEATTARF